MQNGSITRSKRLKGPDIWEFRWRESGLSLHHRYMKNDSRLPTPMD